MRDLQRILITNGIPLAGLALPDSFVMDYPGEGLAFAREELLHLLPKADAVLACSVLDREMIEIAQKLKIIVCYGAGYDAIDMEAATNAGISVANIPDSVTEVTAELAISLILCLARRICELNGKIRQAEPRNAFGLGKYMGTSLKGSTLGIVGMGRIGARVADFGRFMGMKVIYASRSPKPEQAHLGAERCSLETLMKTADFVSLHCPHTPETDQLIDRKLLLLMKPTAYLINTARGRMTDENALLDVLRENRIAGAGLDVFVGEPDVNPAWAALSNVILTPHIGSNTVQARREMLLAAFERIADALAGKKPQNLLNPQVWKGI